MGKEASIGAGANAGQWTIASYFSLTLRQAKATSAAMNDKVADSLIPYDEIVQEALRAVVGRVLRQVETGGGHLPGGHHFYITFKTGAPGVDISPHLTERFPDEMTIVLENRFWDLKAEEDHFSVGLSFNQRASILVIPYAAVTAFVDPSVEFGLQFHVDADDVPPPEHDAAENDDENAAPSSDNGDGGDGAGNVVTVDFGRKK